MESQNWYWQSVEINRVKKVNMPDGGVCSSGSPLEGLTSAYVRASSPEQAVLLAEEEVKNDSKKREIANKALAVGDKIEYIIMTPEAYHDPHALVPPLTVASHYRKGVYT